MRLILDAMKTVFASRGYQLLGVVSFMFFLGLYLLTLPSSYTGGQIGLVSLQFLTGESVVFSMAMATLVALILPLIVYLLRQGQTTNKASAAGGLLVGLATPLLCCSPLLPIAFGVVASLMPALGGAFGARAQGFIATHQTELFSAATLLLALALYQNAKRVVAGAVCRAPTNE